MESLVNSNFTAKIIATALAVVSVLVMTGGVTDPVNVTKLFAIGGFALAALGSVINRVSVRKLGEQKTPLFISISFVAVSLLVLFQSSAPLSQSLYGVYGRNNGFFLYISLSFLLIASLTLSSKKHFQYSIFALIFAGLINVAYGLWVIVFGDFVNWNNQYGNLLGTFGNPNFIGSFFGMFSSALFAAALSKEIGKNWRIVAVLLIPIVFVTILDTKAVQGKVLFVAAAGTALFFYVRGRFASNLWSYVYLFAAMVSFIFALLGTLQKGPLASYLYKDTVSLRGEYWYAGWQTGKSNPWFGVGFDSLGDWYRRSRRESALTLPGVDTVTNAAHNVYLDLFAFGGWPLLISYVALNIYTIVSIVKFITQNKKFDFIFVTLVSVWFCYQLQSIISINQVGLAIWGWVSTGLVIAYARVASETESPINSLNSRRKESPNKVKRDSVFSPKLFAGLFAVVGLLVVAPPLSADMRWREAQLSQDVNKVESVLRPSYMNPLTTNKLLSIVGIFETNGFHDLAYKYALESIKFNPQSYESWRVLTLISKTTEKEKLKALRKMKELDPLNPSIQGDRE
jgi:hypothetical protein